MEEENSHLKEYNECLDRRFKLLRKSQIEWSEELEEDNNCNNKKIKINSISGMYLWWKDL